MSIRPFVCAFLLTTLPALAQFDGPGSPGVSASLIRMFGTNFAFTAQVEYQALDRRNQERVGLPLSFARLGNKIRVTVDMARMRNRERPDALAQLKPLGMDQVVSVIRPDQKTTWVLFPKLSSAVKLSMPAGEAEAFVKPGKMARTPLGPEPMEGHPCMKYLVVATDAQGKRHEATVWNATDLRDFPVCVATREGDDTVVMRFRQVQFVTPDAAAFEPPPGYTQCADMQVLMAGPVVKYMQVNKTAVHSTSPPTATKSKSGKTRKKK